MHHMKHMKHMIGCLLLIGAVVVIRFLGNGLPTWIATAALLACPLMMIWMVVTMSRDHTTTAQGEGSDGGATDEPAHR